MVDATRRGLGERRTPLEVGMPLLGQNGLSESALLKELGHLRWKQISDVLGLASSRIADASGNRLYAVFVYLDVVFYASRPMSSLAENDVIGVASTLRRYGNRLDGEHYLLPAEELETGAYAVPVSRESAQRDEIPFVRMVNSFVAPSGGAARLTATTPAGSALTRIPDADTPDYMRDITAAKSGAELLGRPPDFTMMAADDETVYRLLPERDLNGVGLLYFANYPVIADLCEGQAIRRAFGESDEVTEALGHRALIRRRSAYFANVGRRDDVRVRSHVWLRPESSGATRFADRLFVTTTMHRRSDGRLMYVSSAQKLLERPIEFGRRVAGRAPWRVSLRHTQPHGEGGSNGVDARASLEGDRAASLEATARKLLRACFGWVLGRSEAELDDHAAFVEAYGLESFSNQDILHQLEKTFGPLPATLLFEHTTLNQLARYLVAAFPHVLEALRADDRPARTPSAQATAAPSEAMPVDEPAQPIATAFDSPLVNEGGAEGSRARPCGSDPDEVAIIGLGGRFPKAADIREFWDNLVAGRLCTSEVPCERWDWRDHHDETGEARDKAYTRWGGFLDRHDHFDPLFFNIAPWQAELMDPQQRVFLEVAWAALEDAGYTRASMSRETGVFVGVTTNTYAAYATPEHIPDTDLYDVANRASYLFNFNGPSLAIDTACSSSLTAVHMATNALRSGECETAIAGGVSLTLHPSRIVQFCQKEMLTRDRRCHPFGDGAGGFVDAEGAAAVLLKPLRKALADGDPIYGVIKGTAVNAGGKTSGYTVPSPVAQARLVAKALERARVDARTISYVEAHGTGTKLGDPIEVEGLTRAFRAHTEARGFCAIGSVKSNVGHLIAAAGITGLAKVLLQMKYRTLVPSLGFTPPNPKIPLAESPFYVQGTTAEWREPVIDGAVHPRRAGVSSFGAGGSNAHVIVEAHTDAQGDEASICRPHLLVLSARTSERLDAYVARLIAELERATALDATCAPLRLNDVAYTLQVGRESMERRGAIVAESFDEAIRVLSAFLRREPSDRWWSNGESASGGMAVPDARAQSAITAHADAARRWVSGEPVDWRVLHGDDCHCRRISLPTYPFAGQRYWIPSDDAALPPSRDRAGTPHPWAPRETRFEFQLNRNLSYVADHVVDQRVILPGVVSLEVLCAVGERVGLGRGVRLSSLSWITPVPVETDANLVCTLERQSSKSARFRITSGEAAVCEGTLSALDRRADSLVDIAALAARCRTVWQAEDCYRHFAASGFDYGPSLRSMTELRLGDGEALATLRRSDERSPFTLSPALADGALQAMLALITRSQSSTLYMPFELEALEVRGDLRDEEVFVHVTQTSEGAPARGVTGDLRIVDASGRVLVDVRGLTFARAETRTTTAKVERGDHGPKGRSDVLYYTRRWAVEREPETESTEGPLLLLDDDARRFANLRRPVIRVRSGTGFGRIGTDLYEVAPGSASDFAALLESLASEDRLPTAILHAWCFDDGRAAPEATAESVGTQMERGIYAWMHLAKALLAVDVGDLVLVTAIPAHPSLPHHRALDGFFKSLCRENESWRYLLIEANGEAAHLIVRELGRARNEHVWLTGGRRLVRRTFRVDATTLQRASIHAA